MTPLYRTLAVLFSVATIGAAVAQTAGSAAGHNPAARGNRDSFFYGPLSGAPRGETLGSGLGTNQIGRPKKNGAGAVTPVPEPSQWAMMLAGLALVGFIVRRRNGSR